MKNITHNSIKKKLLAIFLLIAFLFFTLNIRLFWVQIIQGQALQGKAFSQWTRDLPMKADRGNIVDCNGVVLASNSTTYTLYARPNELVNIENIASSLYQILEMDRNKLIDKLSKKGVSEITVAKKLSKQQFTQIIAIDINGLYFTADSVRNYPFGNFLTQVMGFTNADGEGQGGVELYYNDYLKGIDGQFYTQTDLVGKKLNGNVSSYSQPIKGMQTNLTIDFYMQNFAQKAVEDACRIYTPKSASCVIMSAETGAIRALASAPTYDLNNIPRDDMQLLLQGSRNSIVCDSYEPGSTFKILTSAIGIEENKIKSSYYCGGSATVDGQKIKCWRSIGHGSQDFAHGIMNSCNCVFMDIALSVGTSTMYDYFEKFGITQKTGVDIAGEAKGIMLKEDQVKNVDIARIGFGQAIAVTPIQLVTAVSSVVNGGNLYQPYIVDNIQSVDGALAYRHNDTIKNKTVSPNTCSQLVEYLYGVVNEGGGKNARVPGYKIGGKTGTAQKYENGAIASGKYISSFLGFTKVGGETLVCLLLVDEPQGYVYYGSIVAAPLVGNIFRSIYDYKGLAPQYLPDDKGQIVKVEMPNLMDMPYIQAIEKLIELGLQYEIVGEEGKITHQFPAPGTMVNKGNVVCITCQ